MITNLRDRVGSRPFLRKPNVSHLFSLLVVLNGIGLCGKLRKSTFLFKIGTLPTLLDKAVGLRAGLPPQDLALSSEQKG